MRRKVSLLTMLAAWLLATGSHWDLVQTFAWGRMIATYVQTMPLSEAVRLTFTPDNLCDVCEVVSVAKQQEQTPAVPLENLAAAKIPLIHQPAPVFVVELPAGTRLRPDESSWATRARCAPPTPPPRFAV